MWIDGGKSPFHPDLQGLDDVFVFSPRESMLGILDYSPEHLHLGLLFRIFLCVSFLIHFLASYLLLSIRLGYAKKKWDDPSL